MTAEYWRPLTEPPDTATPVLVTIEDIDGVRYVELAELSGRDPSWMLVGGDPLPGSILAWMPVPSPVTPNELSLMRVLREKQAWIDELEGVLALAGAEKRNHAWVWPFYRGEKPPEMLETEQWKRRRMDGSYKTGGADRDA